MRAGAYTDCYRAEVPQQISLARYIEAFYTDVLFKLERFVLRWLMVKRNGPVDSMPTDLYFGSAVVPAIDKATGQAVFSTSFKVLLSFHKRYSRALLHSARSSLERLS